VRQELLHEKTANLGRETGLCISEKAVLGPRSRKGASALCCFSVPLGGGLVSSAGFGAPFFLASARGNFTMSAQNNDSESSNKTGCGCLSSMIWMVGCLAVLACASCIGISMYTTYDASKALEEGDRLFAAGKKAEAAEQYKKAYTGADKRKAEIVQKIVDQELSAGNRDEARRWIDRALGDRVELNFESQAAREMLAQARQDHDTKAAKVKQEQEERIAKAKDKAQQAKEEREKEKANRPGSKVTRQNYSKIEVGMTYDEVTAILGNGRENSRVGDVVTVSWNGAGIQSITIVFGENGKVAAKSIFP
jgi:hypothetical protein